MAKAGVKVLYGECDAEVLAGQAPAIQKAGYQVQTAVGRQGVQEALKKEAFDVIVLGATLTRNDRHHLPYMAKKSHAATRVFVMHTDGERHPYVDGNIDTGRTIEEMVELISRSFPKSAAATAGK